MSGPPRCAICDELADVDVSVHESCLSMLSRMASPEPTPGLREAAEATLTPWHGSLSNDPVDGYLRRCIDIQCQGTSEIAETANEPVTVHHRPGCAVAEFMRRAALAASASPEPTPGLREAQWEVYGDWLVENGLPADRRAAAVQRASLHPDLLAPAPEPTHGVAIWGDYGVTCSCTVVLDWPGGWSRNEVAAGRLVARHAAPEPTGLDADHPDCGDNCACFERGRNVEADAASPWG